MVIDTSLESAARPLETEVMLAFADHVGLDYTRATLPTHVLDAACAEEIIALREGQDYGLGQDYWGDWYVMAAYQRGEAVILKLDYRFSVRQ